MAKFKKGESGNYAGRPPGSGVTGQIRKAITDKAPDLLQVVIDNAINEHDTNSAMALLNKIIPNLKAANEPVEFNINVDGGLSKTGADIVQSIASGHIALDSGTQILSSLANLAKLQEIDQLTSRLEALESKMT